MLSERPPAEKNGTIIGGCYVSVPFEICGDKVDAVWAGEIGLTRDTLPFLDESFDPKKLHPDARKKLAPFESLLQESTRYNRAMCRGFTDKAARMKFTDYESLPVLGYAVTIWRTKDLPVKNATRVLFRGCLSSRLLRFLTSS